MWFKSSRRRARVSIAGLSLVAAVARLHHGTFQIEDNAPGVRALMNLPPAA